MRVRIRFGSVVRLEAVVRFLVRLGLRLRLRIRIRIHVLRRGGLGALPLVAHVLAQLELAVEHVCGPQHTRQRVVGSVEVDATRACMGTQRAYRRVVKECERELSLSLTVAHRRHQLLPQALEGIGVGFLTSHLLEHEPLGLDDLARLVCVVRVDEFVGRRVDQQHCLAQRARPLDGQQHAALVWLEPRHRRAVRHRHAPALLLILLCPEDLGWTRLLGRQAFLGARLGAGSASLAVHAAGLLAVVAVPALKLAWREDIAPEPPPGMHALRSAHNSWKLLYEGVRTTTGLKPGTATQN
eukprot:scaffold60459_cov72-Phaeocystis_antarctica.AAC.3